MTALQLTWASLITAQMFIVAYVTFIAYLMIRVSKAEERARQRRAEKWALDDDAMPTAASVVMYVKRLTSDQRVHLIERLMNTFCSHCGSELEPYTHTCIVCREEELAEHLQDLCGS
jgi:hypothetical protein